MVENHICETGRAIAQWVYGSCGERKVIKERKLIFFVINDYDKLHDSVGQLLLRNPAYQPEGDHAAGKHCLVRDME